MMRRRRAGTMAPTILVTGGAGFIGSNLVEALLRKGCRVRVLDNFSTGKRENLVFVKDLQAVEVLEGDVRDLETCRKAMEGVEVVFHEAALPSVEQSIEDPLTSHDVNVNGTVHLLEAARQEGVRRFVYASSCAIYGNCSQLPLTEELPAAPLSPYAAQKFIGEQYCHLYWQRYGLGTVSLRYFNVFGPRQDPASVYSAVIPRFIDALLRGRRPVIFGDGGQSRDFVYIGDVVEANLSAMRAPAVRGEAFNVACGRRTSLNRLLRALKRILGVEVSPVHRKPREGDVRHSLADIRKARERLAFEPAVDMELGLKKTIASTSQLQ